MTRRFFNLPTILSLLLFVAVCVLWVRSHLVGEFWTWFTADADGASASLFTHQVDLSRGEVQVYRRVLSGTYESEDHARRLAAMVRDRPSRYASGTRMQLPPLRPGSLGARLGLEVLTTSRTIGRRRAPSRPTPSSRSGGGSSAA